MDKITEFENKILYIDNEKKELQKENKNKDNIIQNLNWLL